MLYGFLLPRKLVDLVLQALQYQHLICPPGAGAAHLVPVGFVPPATAAPSCLGLLAYDWTTVQNPGGQAWGGELLELFPELVPFHLPFLQLLGQ